LFFKRKSYKESLSPARLSWVKFKKNKLSIFFLLVIGLFVLLAILGYTITPDSSSFANEQIIELAAKKPGFKTKVLQITKNEAFKKEGFFKKMLYGTKNHYILLPYDTCYFEDTHIVLLKYIDDDKKNYVPKKIHLADVAYALSNEDIPYVSNKNIITFVSFDGQIQSKALNILQNEVSNYHLKTKTYILGSDKFGRDVLSQIIIGSRVSLSVGFISVFISLLIGVFLGAIAGYYKGFIDTIIVWLINVIWSIPTLLLVIAITFALGKGFWQIFIAVGLTMWVEVARMVRGQVLSVREKEYVEAARALGFTNFRIIFKHILPNVISPVIVISAANFASAILIEAGLSFLGIGVQPPMPSWGTMIKTHYSYIILDKAYLAVFPGLAIMIMVMAFMIVGNGLRDALDVKTK